MGYTPLGKCNHIVEIRNDCGYQQNVYAICLDGREFFVDGWMVFIFCPLCGEKIDMEMAQDVKPPDRGK